MPVCVVAVVLVVVAVWACAPPCAVRCIRLHAEDGGRAKRVDVSEAGRWYHTTVVKHHGEQRAETASDGMTL